MQRPILHLLLSACLVAACGMAFARGPWRASEGNTSGWELMSPDERIAHQATIRGIKTYDECSAYRERHHRLMAERAQAAGKTLGHGRRDFCSHLAPEAPAR